jgi:hypothetical protein
MFVKRQREKETKVFIDTFKVKIQGEASSFGHLHSICFIAFLEHSLWCDLFSNQQLLDCLFYNLTTLRCGEQCLCHLNVKMLGMFFFVFFDNGEAKFHPTKLWEAKFIKPNIRTPSFLSRKRW